MESRADRPTCIYSISLRRNHVGGALRNVEMIVYMYYDDTFVIKSCSNIHLSNRVVCRM